LEDLNTKEYKNVVYKEPQHLFNVNFRVLVHGVGIVLVGWMKCVFKILNDLDINSELNRFWSLNLMERMCQYLGFFNDD
jgi:hypothetical protein